MTTTPPHQSKGSKVKRLPRKSWPEDHMDVIGGSYITYTKEKGSEGKAINIMLPSPDRNLREYELDQDEDMESWLSEMDDEQVEAGRMIYYHKWAFERGGANNKRLWEAFEEEKHERWNAWNELPKPIPMVGGLGVSNRGSGSLSAPVK